MNLTKLNSITTMTYKHFRSQVLDEISKDTNLANLNKELLFSLLHIESHFIHFCFGIRDKDRVNWDCMYTEIKSHFISALMNNNWTFSFNMDKTLFTITISFEKQGIINDFLFNKIYENDPKKEFDQIKIFFTREEVMKALENGCMKVPGTIKLLQDHSYIQGVYL